MRRKHLDGNLKTGFRDFFPILLILVVGLTLTVIAQKRVEEWQWGLHQHEFSEIADDRIQLLEISIQTRLAALYSLQSFYTARSEVTHEEFTKFSTHILRLYPDIIALEWLPRVPAEKRAAFEAAAQKEISPDFTIHERSPSGRKKALSRRNEYFPIYFAEPFERNKIAAGFDEMSDPEHARRMARSRDNNNVSATRIMNLWRLSNAEKNRYGFTVFLPVYTSPEAASKTQRRENLKGYVAAVFHADKILRAAFSGTDLSELQLSFYAENSAGKNILFDSYSITQSPQLTEEKGKHFNYRASFYIADQNWVVNAENTKFFKAPEHLWESNAVLILGLLLTLLICVFMISFSEKRREEYFRRMSLHDPLTGLYNRRGFLLLVEEQMKFAHRKRFQCLALFIDLDSFKTINDTYGHKAGDEILCAAADILRNAFRVSDVIARTGGDEFAVFALETSREDEKTLFARLEDRLREFRAVNDKPYSLAWSIGTASTTPDSPLDVETLLDKADQAMYEQKKESKKRRAAERPRPA